LELFACIRCLHGRFFNPYNLRESLEFFEFFATSLFDANCQRAAQRNARSVMRNSKTAWVN
jgi:hypothetical protein